jgi:hypothetical protein
MLSPQFLYHIHNEIPKLNSTVNLYWLDAHQFDYKWPLADEIRFITTNQQKAIVMVDDTEVPEQPQFQFAEYEGQKCDINYLKSALNPNKEYQIIHPKYTEHTSQHHQLIGVTIIVFGFQLMVDKNFSTRLFEPNVEQN